MDMRVKQRIVGIIVLVVLLIIVIPLLFTGAKKTHPGAEMNISIPKPPPIPTIQKGKPAVKSQSAWTVQLASFTNKANADSLAKKLQQKGFSAYVTKVKANNGYVYRVFVGPEVELQQAQDLVKKLHQTLHLKGMIVRYKV